MISKLYNKSNTKVLIAVIGLFAIFVAVVLPYFADLSTRLIGVADSPDTNFSFDLKFLYDLRESYGIEGRRIYLILRFTFDLVWPVVYTIFLLFSLIELMKRTTQKMILLYIPIIGMISSALKWLFLLLGFLLIFYYLFVLLLKKIKPSI